MVSWLLKINPHPPYGPHILIKWPYKFNIKSINQYFIGSSRYYRRPIYVDYPKKNKLAIRTSHFLIRWQNGATIKVSFWIFPNWMNQFLDIKNLDIESIFMVLEMSNTVCLVGQWANCIPNTRTLMVFFTLPILGKTLLEINVAQTRFLWLLFPQPNSEYSNIPFAIVNHNLLSQPHS